MLGLYMHQSDMISLNQIEKKGFKPLNTDQLIEVLSFNPQSIQNRWYSTNLVEFVGKDMDGKFQILVIEARFIEGFAEYPVIADQFDYRIANSKAINSNQLSFSNVQFQISNSVFQSLLTHPEPRVLSLEKLLTEYSENKEFFGRESASEVLLSDFAKNRLGSKSLKLLVRKMVMINEDISPQINNYVSSMISLCDQVLELLSGEVIDALLQQKFNILGSNGKKYTSMQRTDLLTNATSRIIKFRDLLFIGQIDLQESNDISVFAKFLLGRNDKDLSEALQITLSEIWRLVDKIESELTTIKRLYHGFESRNYPIADLEKGSLLNRLYFHFTEDRGVYLGEEETMHFENYALGYQIQIGTVMKTFYEQFVSYQVEIGTYDRFDISHFMVFETDQDDEKYSGTIEMDKFDLLTSQSSTK
ncbi:MAG: hypothetical protein ACRCXZ_05970 [Patescibacteria group bacterium]